MRKKHVICFIDDDPEELRRCKSNLEPHFVIATGTSISKAIEDLAKRGFEKPNLFLLDLNYPEGSTSSSKELLCRLRDDLSVARLFNHNH